MRKKPLTAQEINEVQKSLEPLGLRDLATATVARAHLPATQWSSFQSNQQLQHVLMFAQSEAELQEGFGKIDWNQIQAPCDLLFVSANPQALQLAPIQWWGSAHSTFKPNIYEQFQGVYTHGIECEWVVGRFLTRTTQRVLGSVTLSAQVEGGALALKTQQNMWKVLYNKGLNGSTRINSGIFAGYLEPRKFVDICLVYHELCEDKIPQMLDTTNWEEPEAVSETAFALSCLDLNQKDQKKLAEKVAQYLPASQVNCALAFGKNWEADAIFVGLDQPVTVGMALVENLTGHLLNSNLLELKRHALAYYANLNEDQQREAFEWWYEKKCQRNDPGKILPALIEMRDHSHTSVAHYILQRVAYYQYTENLHREKKNHLADLNEVLTQLSSVSEPVLNNEFLLWIVEHDQLQTTSSRAAALKLQQWCVAPTVLQELVDTYPSSLSQTKSVDEELEAWAKAAVLRIHIGPTATTPLRERKM